jgi:hypothetical protein
MHSKSYEQRGSQCSGKATGWGAPTRVQSLGAAQFVEKNPLVVPPVQHPACVVQSNQGVVDCGPAQATVAIPGVLQGLGVFSTGKQSFLLI